MSDERKISERYRSLSREEPPRHLDDAILAAARRAAATRPAPLVVPSGRQRWYFPLAAAAIIVLAVAVTMHVEREQPDLEVAEAPPSAPAAAREEQAAAAQAPAELPRAFTPDPKPAPAPSRELRAQRDTERLADLQKSQAAPASPAPPPASASAPAPAQDAISGARESGRADAGAKPFSEMQQAPARVPQATPASPMREEARARASRAPDAAPAVTGALGPFAYTSPEQWLQGIADLRRQGRHEEADKALAEFRRAYPDYKISEAILQKIERR
jgi:hypothetical protein